MTKEIQKITVYVDGTKEDGTVRRRAYHNLTTNVDEQKLSAFGRIIGELTGEATQNVDVVETSSVKED